MQIEFTQKQFKEMLLAAMFYSWIRGGLADGKGEDFKQYEELESYLLQIAKRENMTELFENFKDELIPSDELSEEEEEIMDEYDDDVFWHELTMRLGKRDFYRDMTDEEKKEAKENGWLPDRVHEFYDKYEKEFDKYGIGRLEVKRD